MLYLLKEVQIERKCIKMSLKYPKSLHKIFLKLIEHNIKPIIVGGYIRDALLQKESHDIDIELYNTTSLEYVEKLLEEFGSVNGVGKSFGIVKLRYKNIDLDFSLPRSDSKIAVGHQGFHIEVNSSLDFKTASSRRDFTINAMGYDVQTKQLLDPFDGKKDLQEKRLKAVDLKKFDEDPLRVLRAIMFHARFEFTLDTALFHKCKTMIENNVLQELPQERIFEEIKKILLKAKRPSKGFLLLKQLGGFHFFTEFSQLTEEEYSEIVQALDRLNKEKIENEESILALMLAILCSKFSKTATKSFLNRITKNKKLITMVEKLTQTQLRLEKYSNYDVYKLATQIEINFFVNYLDALYPSKKEIKLLHEKAKNLGVLYKKMPPLITGKDLIAFGIKPSEKFSKILTEVYEAQMHEMFTEKDEAIKWLKNQREIFIMSLENKRLNS